MATNNKTANFKTVNFGTEANDILECNKSLCDEIEQVLVNKLTKDKMINFLNNIKDVRDITLKLVKEINDNKDLPIDLFTGKHRNPTEIEFILSINSEGIVNSNKDGIKFICRKNKTIIFNIKLNKFDCVENKTANLLDSKKFIPMVDGTIIPFEL